MSEDETVTICNALKPERSRTFLEIVVSYPAFCTYPEYEGKPYYAIKFEENGETIVGFGTYKPEVLSQYLREYFIPSAEPERKTGKWIEVYGYATPGGDPVWKCSECGKGIHVYGIEAPSYNRDYTDGHQWVACPNCGAEMTRGDR